MSEHLDWLVDQLERWPTRVHPERTINIEYLMKEAAKEIRKMRTTLEMTGRQPEGHLIAKPTEVPDCWDLVDPDTGAIVVEGIFA